MVVPLLPIVLSMWLAAVPGPRMVVPLLPIVLSMGWMAFAKFRMKDRTGIKGTLSSIKEGEKLDVFLARGCGQLTIEVCEGVYGKELFQAMKRVGHHAKHELLLLKWPVLITNRVALAAAGLWWGGEESSVLSQ